MARIRTIKPEFFRHEELHAAEKNSSLPLRLAFAGLWTVADREGLFKWQPKQIKLDVLPFDDVDINEVLEALRYHGFIIKYEKEGKFYGFIPSFKDHQVINTREAASKIPKPDASLQLHAITVTREVHAQGEGKGKEGKGKEHISVREALCAVFAKTYKEPEDRFPAEAGFYKDVDHQAELITQVHKAEEAVKQIKAYVQFCKSKDRKVIGSAWKLSETILSSDWVKLLNPDARGPDNKFKEAEFNKTQWKLEYWEEFYADKLKTDPEFKKHFGYEKL